MYKGANDAEEQEQLIKHGPGFCERIFYNTKFQIVLVLILCAFIGIGTPFIWQFVWRTTQHCCRIESDLRYDCYPLEDTRNRSEREITCNKTAHCCWDNNTAPNQIQCFYGMVTKDVSTHMPGYSIVSPPIGGSILRVEKIPRYMDLNNTNRTIGAVVRRSLAVNITHFTPDHFRVKISSENITDEKGYDLEKEFHLDQQPRVESIRSNAKVSLKSKTNSSMFSLSVRRNVTGHLIFNTGDFSPFIYADGFIEITTLLPNDLLYGLGQSPSQGFKHNMTYPESWQIFNKYNLNLTTNQTNWFGSHPFYMGWTDDDMAYGVLLLNSYPIQVTTNSRPSLTFRTIGGPLDFHFFLGPTPKDVYKQLVGLIGRPTRPPYWALGFHMCRTNNDLGIAANTGAELIVKRMRNLGIPFDSDCGSAALSSAFVDTDKLAKFYQNNLSIMRALVVQIPHRAVNSAWKDSALKMSDNITNYQGLFYDWQDMNTETKYPNISVIYPSFEGRTDLLTKEFEQFGSHIGGTFLDYNTPLDLRATTGLNMSFLCKSLLGNNTWNQFYYWKLNEYNPCLDSIDPYHPLIDPISLHNLYGHRHMKVVKDVLQEKTQNRTLVMSLSTFIGSGAYGGHIGTNMNATWDMLLQTHIQTLEFNMYGIPLVGFPVCGFKGRSSDEELCLRWYQLAALQPFMISHRAFGESLTDPSSVTRSNSTQEALKSSILIRYRLLPYLYTLFYKANQTGEPVVRPLFYDFPKDKKTFRIDRQFLLGSALMASPVFQPKAKSVEAYFPKDPTDKKATIWYDYYSGRRIAAKEGRKYNLSAIEYHINLHLRGGYVIPTQKPGLNTEESRNNAFQLLAALDSDQHAEGDLYIDDGKSLNPTVHLYTTFKAEKNNFTIIKNESAGSITDLSKLSEIYSPHIDMIKIYGVIESLHPEYFNVTCYPSNKPLLNNQGVPYNKQDYIHNPYSGVLTLRHLNINFKDECDQFVIDWKFQDYEKLTEDIKDKSK